jgi:hypothetical protein
MIALQIEASYIRALLTDVHGLQNLQHGDRVVWSRPTESNQAEEIGYVVRNAENKSTKFST